MWFSCVVNVSLKRRCAGRETEPRSRNTFASLTPLITFYSFLSSAFSPSHSLSFILFLAIISHFWCNSSQPHNYNDFTIQLHLLQSQQQMKWKPCKLYIISRNNFVAHPIYYVALKVLLKTKYISTILFHEMNVWNIYFRIYYVNIYWEFQCWRRWKSGKENRIHSQATKLSAFLFTTIPIKIQLKLPCTRLSQRINMVCIATSSPRTETQFTEFLWFPLDFNQLQSGSLFNCNFLAFTQFNARLQL